MAFEAQLTISDGTTEISLINLATGIHLFSWTPAITQYKGGGVFRNNPQATGRRLVSKTFDTAIETFDLKVDNLDRNALIRQMQEVLRLLEKATDYWTSDWQNTIVFLTAQAECEDNPRYAEIVSYSVPQLDNPYAQPFLSITDKPLFDNITLAIERAQWKANIPGNGTAVQISNTQAFDGRTLGRTATTTVNNVFVGNKHTIANLTDIYTFDNSLAAFSANLMDAALPFDLFPDPAGDEDIIYFGIDTSLSNSGPFTSLVLDIGDAAAGTHTIEWEYWDGAAWSSLTVFDWTDDSGEFRNTGVNSVHWITPSDWVTRSVNGVTGYWVRARIDTFTSMTTIPTQQNRDIYSIILPYIEIDSRQVAGDIPALSRIYSTLRGTNQPTIISPTPTVAIPADLRDDRVLVGLRSITGRESQNGFTAYLNCSDEQNQGVITASANFTTSFGDSVDTPTGRIAIFSPGTGAEPMIDRVRINLSTDHPDFFGKYHVFVRARQVGGNIGNIKFRVLATIGQTIPFFPSSGFVLDSTREEFAFVIDDFQLVDMGQLTIPRPPNGEYDSDLISIMLEASVSVASQPDLYIQDIILMPIDEWAGDFPGIYQSLLTTIVLYVARLDIDSITEPKNAIISPLRNDAKDDDATRGFVPSITNGSAMLQSNTTQKLWFLHAQQHIITGTHTGGNDEATLTDAAADFINQGVQVGDVIVNFSGGQSFATITAVTATTITGSLIGGADADWDTNDIYYVITSYWISRQSEARAVEVFKNEQYLGMRGNR